METASNRAEADTPELEALFESIVAEKTGNSNAPVATSRAAAPKRTPLHRTKAKLPEPAAERPLAKANGAAPESEAGEKDMIARIGHMTRQLHDTLRQLGYDSLVEQAAAAIPDARDRLAYVAQMTEQAANRSLSATEKAKPWQEELERDATRLGADWDRVFANQMAVDDFKALAERTRDYLHRVPDRTRATNAELMEIMMAQDFQDLTGQVIKKITDLAQSLEDQLVSLLVEHAIPMKRAESGDNLLNGPVIKKDSGVEVVTDQTQVDNLLESLGF